MSQRDIWPTKILLIWKEEEKNLICFLFFWIVPSLRLFIGQLDIFHMLHTCTEKEKNTKGHRSLAGKRWKKSSISPKRTLPTHNRKWDTLYYKVSLPVDRVAASHVTPQCQFMLFIAQAWSKNRPNKVKKEKSAGPGVVTIVLAEKPDQKLGGFNSYPHMPLVPVPWWPIKTHRQTYSWTQRIKGHLSGTTEDKTGNKEPHKLMTVHQPAAC